MMSLPRAQNLLQKLPHFGLPDYATPGERLIRLLVLCCAGLVLWFLVAPLFVVIPLSLSKEPFFTFPIAHYSWRWYVNFFADARWMAALENSFVTGLGAMILSTILGTLASLGVARPEFPYRRLVMSFLISPMIIPVVVVAVGTYLVYAHFGLVNTRTGLILGHTSLATPYVVMTVTATLANYDHNLSRAAHSLGASGWSVFWRVTFPQILPGVVSGAILAFAMSFDEVVMALFLTNAERRTLPVQMFAGIRDLVNPTIMAAATLLLMVSLALFGILQILSRRGKAGGVTAH